MSASKELWQIRLRYTLGAAPKVARLPALARVIWGLGAGSKGAFLGRIRGWIGEGGIRATKIGDGVNLQTLLQTNGAARANTGQH